MEIDGAEAQRTGRIAEYKNTTYHFCSEACKRKFVAAPEKYVGRTGEREHVAKNVAGQVNPVSAAHHD
jgi:YHS domain-containing protein